MHCVVPALRKCFSALQRAEIAEIQAVPPGYHLVNEVSVLFNEPKLLKSQRAYRSLLKRSRFSALQRAEIAEIDSSFTATTFAL